jgi:hypothetical protein
MKLSLSILIIMISLASATTLLVPSQFPAIRDAISAAQNGDTVLVSPGEYCGGFSFKGKNIVVLSTHGADDTFIKSPFADYHCVMFMGGEDSTAVLDGFSITNIGFDGISHDGRDPVDHGGGIYVIDSSPTIRNNIVTNCATFGSGAGIYVSNSSSRIENCTISDNHAYGAVSGGGLYATYAGNSLPFIIINSTFSNNHSQYNGGLHLTHSYALIINNDIVNNYADHDAGGVGLGSNNLHLYGNFISGNEGGSGGGVRIYAGEAILIGNLIVENTAGIGGGVACSPGYLLMENNTVCMNIALGSVYGTGGLSITQCDTAVVTNNIIWGNQAPNGTVPNLLVYDTYLTISYSNIGGGYDSIWVDPTSTLNWGPGNIDIDPEFETGPFGDYHLPWGSPCVDAGNPASEYNDPEDPFSPGYALWPAMGFIRNDMGAFGGGGVDYWLTVEEEELSPAETGLSLKSFPNPFSSSCTVCYQLDEASQVNLLVFDLSGRLVETLVDEVVPSGMHSEYFDGSGLCSGVYLIRLVAGDLSTSRRCIIIRD